MADKPIKLIVHVGVHKTGTSALQSLLWLNRDLLTKYGVWYNTPTGSESHVNLAKKFLSDDAEWAIEDLERIISDAAENDCHTALISSEVFCEHPFNEQAFRTAIEGIPTDIIAYIRRPDEIVLSAYNQVVRDINQRWTKKLGEQLAYDPTYINIIGKFTGDKPWNLIVAPYDKAQWTNGNLLDDFLAMIGVDIDNLDRNVGKDKENSSLPMPLLEILRLSNMREASTEEHVALMDILYTAAAQSPELYRSEDPIDLDLRVDYCRRLDEKLHVFRPYFRKGFKEGFLLPSAVSA